MKIDSNEILASVNEIFDDIKTHRRTIHKYPELGFQEYKTADYIRSVLSSLGIGFKTYIKTATVASIGHGDGPCVALRADIDGLPILEETGLDFASERKGFMHACGHDMHTAMLLGAARLLKENEDKLPGRVLLIFQPAEEVLPGGAISMIEEGAFANEKPIAFFGQHIFPNSPSGTISINSGPVMAATDEVYIDLQGKGAHAAQPNMGHDPVMAASQIALFFQSVIGRIKNPVRPGVLGITSIQAGDTVNVIPGHAKMMGVFRSMDDEWRREMLTKIPEWVSSLSKLYGVESTVRLVNGYPSVVNDSALVTGLRKELSETFGSENLLEFEPKMWAEDFAYYGRIAPSVFWFLCVRPDGINDMPPLHNCHLAPDERAMITGTAALYLAAVNTLSK